MHNLNHTALRQIVYVARELDEHILDDVDNHDLLQALDMLNAVLFKTNAAPAKTNGSET